MYKKVSTDMNFCQREEQILDFWKKNNIIKKSFKKNEGNKDFTFYDGPPTANGKPHIGHVLTRVIKDIIPKYKTMKGYQVMRKAGWDTHGLPVELEVEKMLGIDGKQEIEKYGIEPFIQKCKESVWKYKQEWEDISNRVCYWADMEHPYITYDDNYIESVWWSLKEIHKKGLIYKGHKIVPYCPRCGTALSSHEVAQGYKDIKEESVFIKFKLVNKDEYFLAWTTTPWTLPSNVALCMNPKEMYARVKYNNEIYIMAESLLNSVLGEGNYEILDKKIGKSYEYVEYEPLYSVSTNGKKGYYVTVDDYVTLTDGTGIVHNAPAFGEDDAKVGRIYDLPFVQMVDERGNLKEGLGELSNLFVKKADPLIIKDLKNRNLLFRSLPYEHSYPFCWRCDTPLIYYARSSWFIEMSKLRKDLLENNSKVNWMPQSIGSGRMGNFLENVIDWGISRERYWGTPLPIWVCDKCNKIHVIGSKDELMKLTGINNNIELHKPYLDPLTFKCECGGTMKRTPEVLDCWYDSGSMPFAQHHYPFENKELFEKHYPAQFISEAVDQTRGWFYTLLAVSTAVFNKSPFENCIVLGHVNDANGIKMSKHKGNVVSPWDAVNLNGADAVRWYFYTGSALWMPSRFSADNVSECQRKFMGTLWNTYAFYVLYADIDKFDPSKYKLNECKLSLMDKWILSKLNTLIKFVDEGLNEYKITETAKAIQDFTDELSNWYVRRCRERYWGPDMTEDKIAAYQTLYEVLVTLIKLSAPYVPFVTEDIYQNLVTPFFKNAPESIHLCDFPVVNNKMIDKKLEEDMEFILNTVFLGRGARAKSNIKNRQPLSTLYIRSDYNMTRKEGFEIIEGELNIKNVEQIQDDDKFISYQIKPQLKTLGAKYRSLIVPIREFLMNCKDTKTIVKSVENNGVYSTTINNMKVDFTKEDLLITVTNAEGFAVESNHNMAVIIDTNLNQELIEEGIVREFVSKVQTMRKDSGFEVVDHINLDVRTNDELIKIVNKHKESISQDVLADSINLNKSTRENDKEWDINGLNAIISVSKI